MILIQELSTNWSKESRSGIAAKNRNSTPLCLPLRLPPQRPEDKWLIVHQIVRFDEARDFQPSAPSETRDDLLSHSTYKATGLWIVQDEDSILLKFNWNVECGAPERPNRHLGRLKWNQWARFRFNGRHGGARGWHYQQTVYNIALMELGSAEILNSTEPMFEAAEIAALK